MNIKLTYQLFPQFYSGPLEIEMAFAAKTLRFYLLIWTLFVFENILAEDEFHPTAAVWSIRSRPFIFILLHSCTIVRRDSEILQIFFQRFIENRIDRGKGQLISKCSFGVMVWTKMPKKNSDLEFEKWSNHKIKALYNVF